MEIKTGFLEGKKSLEDKGLFQHKFVLSSNSIDRDFEQVNIAGLQIKNFLNNPVMYFMHRLNDGYPIGKWIDIKKEKKGDNLFLTAVTDYNPDDEEAMKVMKFVQNGYLRMSSIGFIPLAIEKVDPPPEYAEIIQRVTYDGLMRVVKKAEMTEASIVGIGSNPDALREEFTKGLLKNITEDDMNWFNDRTFEPHKAYFFGTKNFETQRNDMFRNEFKVGQVLNKNNKERLKKIIELANEIIAEAEPEPEPPEDIVYTNNLPSQQEDDKIEVKQNDIEIKNEIKIYNEYELLELIN